MQENIKFSFKNKISLIFSAVILNYTKTLFWVTPSQGYRYTSIPFN